MELLEVSIMNDGYTQPIVTWNNPEKNKTEVIDGFHRNRVGKESPIVSKRIMGFLPVVNIRKEQSGKNDRIASTIRHNRARGKHQVDAMSEIVIELKNRNWTNQRIAKQLGMDNWNKLNDRQKASLISLGYNAGPYFISARDYGKEIKNAIENDNMELAANIIKKGPTTGAGSGKYYGSLQRRRDEESKIFLS